MERNISKNGLLNWLVLLVATVAVALIARSAESSTAEVGVCLLAVGTFVALISWFQMRLEAREEAERLEFEALARSKSSAALFTGSADDTLHARRARQQFEKWLVPAFSVLLFLLEAAAVGWFFLKLPRTDTPVPPHSVLTLAMAGFAGLGLVLFLIGTYSARLARYEGHRLLRPGASGLLMGAVICALAAATSAADYFDYRVYDRWVAWALVGVLAIVALETLLGLIFEIYRPRVQGKEARLMYESRLVGLLGSSGGLFSTAAHAIDYQFGFKVSETWFYQYLRQEIGRLALLALALLWIGSCVVFIDPSEQGLLERFGRPVDARGVLEPGARFKWPWPVDRVYRHPVRQLQSINIGFVPDPKKEHERTILWTTKHYEDELNMLVASRDSTTDPANASDLDKAVPVNFLTVSVPIQYYVRDLRQWVYNHANAAQLLERIATREVARYLISVDMIEFMSFGRLKAAEEMQRRIQKVADGHQLGVHIAFVGLQDIHPPIGNKEIQVAAAFEQEIGAQAQAEAKVQEAYGYRAEILPRAEAEAAELRNNARGRASQQVAEAKGDAGRFQGQLIAYEAAPGVFAERYGIESIGRAIAPARKFVVLSPNARTFLQLNLEQKIQDELGSQIYLENPNQPNPTK